MTDYGVLCKPSKAAAHTISPPRVEIRFRNSGAYLFI